MHQLGDVLRLKAHLGTVEVAISSLPNRSTGYSPFYLNYGYHLVIPSDFRKGDEVVTNEAVSHFAERLRNIYNVAKHKLEVSIQQQKKYYDRRHRAVQYAVGDHGLLSTANLRVKNVPSKLQPKFIGPFTVLEKISPLVYKLKLPDSWQIHNVFHVSLLRLWHQPLYPVTQPQVIPELEEPNDFASLEIEKVLRWRWICRGRRLTKDYLVMWGGWPIDELSWVPEDNFPDPAALRTNLTEDKPLEALSVP